MEGKKAGRRTGGKKCVSSPEVITSAHIPLVRTQAQADYKGGCNSTIREIWRYSKGYSKEEEENVFR